MFGASQSATGWRSGVRTTVAAAALLALGLVVLGARACDRTPRGAVASRVLLLGVDGADWEVIDHLIAQGRMPNFERMKREGTTGPLRSQEPTFSPVVWATITTGKGPRKHGIQGFTVPDPEGRSDHVPVTSNLVRASRLWEILSRRGRTVGVIGFWTTWPATPVRGFLLSERTWPIQMGPEGWPVTSRGSVSAPRRTYPEELAQRVEPFIVTRQTLTDADTARVDVRGALAVTGAAGPSVADTYAKDLTYSRIAKEWFAEELPELAALYLSLPDVSGHYFYDAWLEVRRREKAAEAPGGAAPSTLPEKQAKARARAAHTFEQAYELADAVLGDLLDVADRNTLVMVVSDHGFGPNDDKRTLHVGDGLNSSPRSWHRLDGVLLARGPGVREGEHIAGARVTDITPTILFALGEPVGADMDGVVLKGLFEGSAARTHIRSVPTHDGSGGARDTAPIPSEDDEAIRSQLRSLGYVK